MDYNVTFRKKDKSIQCIISYKDENEKWKQKSKQGFKAQKDAKPWIKKTVDDLKDVIELNKKLDPVLIGLTFKELVDKFIKHKSLYREPTTIMTIKTARNKFSDLDDYKVADISRSDIQHCVDLMVKEGLATITISMNISRIRSVFNYAIQTLEILDKNPCSKIEMPTEKKGIEKTKALTKTQLNNLINKIDDPFYKLITMIAGTCGLRLGEIMGLTWDNIDFKESTLEVNKQWKVIKEWEYGFGDVKRSNSNRIVPVPKKTLNELKKYKKVYPIHTSKRIFYTRVNNGYVSTYLAKLFTSLGSDITVHDLRHTYATHLISNGLDFKTVAQLMGHDVQETIKTYSHVTDDMIKKATNIIEKIF